VFATRPNLDHPTRGLRDLHDHATVFEPHSYPLDRRTRIAQRTDSACDVSLRNGGRSAGHYITPTRA
jgi:hypothetical protein